MLLEARSPSCFSSEYLLKLDGRPVGRFRGRWFSEGIIIRLTERLQLQFEKTSWLGSGFQLIDVNSREVLAAGKKSGFFTGTWDLQLRIGPAQLVRTSLFSSAFGVRQCGQDLGDQDLGDQYLAHASRIGWCEGGWRVEDDGTLDATDLIFTGLIYHTVLQRRRSSQSAAGT